MEKDFSYLSKKIKIKNPLCSINLTLDMKDNFIRNLPTNVEASHLISLQETQQIIDSYYSVFVPISGNPSSNPITGNVNFNTKTLAKNIPDPISSEDALNYRTLKNISNREFSNLASILGDSFFGNINMDFYHITSVPTPITEDNPVNKLTVDAKYNRYISLIKNQNLQGGLTFDGTTKITNLKNASTPKELVNLETLKSKIQTAFSLYLPILGGTLSNNINLSFQRIINLPEAKKDSEAINLLSLSKNVSNLFSDIVPLSGGILSGDLNINNNRIVNLGTSFNNYRTSTLKDINDLKDYKILLSGNTALNPISNDLTLKGLGKISCVGDATEPLDGVNLKTLTSILNTETSSYVSLQGSIIENDLNMNNNTITNISSLNEDNLCSKQYLINEALNYIPLTGSSIPITGNLDFNNTNTIKNISNTNNPQSLLSLQQSLEDISNVMRFYLPLTGGSLSNDLNMNNQKVTNLADPVNDSDSLNLQTIITSLKSFLPLSGNTPSSPITGNLIFDNSATITGVLPAFSSNQAINFQQAEETILTKSNSFLSLFGGTITGSINMNDNPITNLPYPETSDNIINLLCLHDFIEEARKDLLPLTGGTLIKDLNMNKNLVTGLKDISLSSDPTDAVNKNYLSLKEADIVPLTGTELNKKISGDIVFNKMSTITGLKQPENDTDIITLNSLNTFLTTTKNTFVPLSGGAISGLVNMNNNFIQNVSDPIQNDQIINIKTLKNKSLESLSNSVLITGAIMNGIINMSNHKIINLTKASENDDACNLENLQEQSLLYLPLSGNSSLNPLKGNLIFQNSTLTNLATPLEDFDLINLGFLKAYLINNLSNYLPLSGGSMSGSIDMSNYPIENLAKAIDETDLVNKETLEELIGAAVLNYMPLSGGSMNNNLIASDYSLNDVGNPINLNDAVNLQTLNYNLEKFVPLTGTTISSIKGDIFFDNTHLIKLLAVGTTDEDAVTFQQTKDIIIQESFNYLPLTGGTMSGFIDMNDNFITNLPPASTSTDLINYQQCKEKLSLFIPLTGSSTSLKNVFFNKLARITNLGYATSDYEAVNLQKVYDEIDDVKINYLPISGGTLKGSLDLNFHKIIQLANTQEMLSLINLQELENKINELANLKVKKTGSNLTGTLDMGGFSIIITSSNTSQNSLINLLSAKNLKNTFLSFLGATSSNPITGDIELKNTKITGLKNPTASLDALTLSSLNKEIATAIKSYLLLSGGTMKGNINMNNNNLSNLKNSSSDSDIVNLFSLDSRITTKSSEYLNLTGDVMAGIIDMNNQRITNLKDPLDDLDGCSQEYVNKESLNYLKLEGNTSSTPITGNIVCDNVRFINLEIASENEDAIVLINVENKVNSITTLLLSLSGGTLNSLDLGNFRITNLKNPSFPNHALNKITLITEKEKYLSLSGNTASKPITGDVFFNGVAKITGLKDPEQNSDALNLKTLNANSSSKFILYLPLKGGILTGSLNMNNNKIINIKNAINDNELVNLHVFNVLLSQEKNNKLDLDGKNMMLGSINMSNHIISNIDPSPIAPSDGVSLAYTEEQINKFLLFSGNSISSPITGDLHLNNDNTIIGFSDPIDNNDLVNLKTLNLKQAEKLEQFLPLTGGDMTGSIDMGFFNIICSEESTELNSAVNLKQVKTQLSDSLPLSGTSLNKEISGNIVLNNVQIKGLKAPVNNFDAVNKVTTEFNINQKKVLFLPLSGGILTGSLDMGNNKIINLAFPSEDFDVVNLNALESSSSQFDDKLSLSGGTMSGNLSMNSKRITNLKASTDDLNLINKSQMDITFSSYIPLRGNSKDATIVGSISCQNTIFTGLGNAISSNEAINKITLENSYSTNFSNYLTVLGDRTMNGNLNMNTKAIINLSPPVDDFDGATLSSIDVQKENLLSNFLQTSVGSSLEKRTITGPINLNNNSIINLSNSKSNSDAVNLGETKSHISNTFINYLPLSGGVLNGNIDLGNNSIINLAKALEQDQAINLTNVNDISNTLLTYNSSVDFNVSNTFLFSSGNTVIQEKDASGNADLVNLKSFNNLLEKESLRYLSLSGGTLSGQINLTNHFIKNVPTPTDLGDIVNFLYLKNTLKTLLPLNGTSPGKILTGNIVCSRVSKITGLKDAINENEALNFRSLKSIIKDKVDRYISLEQGNLTGRLTINEKIINLKDPSSSNEAVNLSTLNKAINLEKSKYLSKTGGTMKGSINMNSYKIRNLGNATNDKDLTLVSQITARYLSLSSNLIDQSDPIIQTTLNLGGNKITNLADAVSEKDLVTFSQMNNSISSITTNYLPLTGAPMNGAINMNNNFITNISEGTGNSDAVTKSQMNSLISNLVPLAGNPLQPITGTLNLNNNTITNLPIASDLNLLTTGKLKSLIDQTSQNYTSIYGSVRQGVLNMNDNKIINCGLATLNKDLASKANFTNIQPSFNSYYNLDGSQNLTGPLNMGGNLIKNIRDASQDIDVLNLKSTRNILSSRKSSFVLKAGDTMTGNLQVSSLNNLQNASTPSDVVNLETFTSLKSSVPFWIRNAVEKGGVINSSASGVFPNYYVSWIGRSYIPTLQNKSSNADAYFFTELYYKEFFVTKPGLYFVYVYLMTANSSTTQCKLLLNENSTPIYTIDYQDILYNSANLSGTFIIPQENIVYNLTIHMNYLYPIQNFSWGIARLGEI